MRHWKSIIAGCLTAALVLGHALAAEQKAAKNLTCCQKAAAENKECSHKCCINAHREGKSCEKCNPNKEDLALLKKKAAEQSKK